LFVTSENTECKEILWSLQKCGAWWSWLLVLEKENMRGLMLLECSATEIMAGDIRFRSFGDRPRLQSNQEDEQPMDPDEAESQAHIMSIALFEQLYSRWVKEEESLVASLRKALEIPNGDRELSRLVKAGFESYSQVVEAKIQVAQEDATYIAAGAWKTPLEAGLMWMGGWRPSTAIVFAFSLMGMQIQMDFKKILEGIEVPSMAALSSKQLSRLVIHPTHKKASIQ
jgi:hypothetical protein